MPGDPELAVHLGSVRTQPAVASQAEPNRERITRWWRQGVQGTTIAVRRFVLVSFVPTCGQGPLGLTLLAFHLPPGTGLPGFLGFLGHFLARLMFCPGLGLAPYLPP